MLAAGIRRFARAAHSLLVRLLHPLRRRAAFRTLADRRPLRSVLFVCHGNICRSPYAAAALARRLPPPVRGVVRVDSAGFCGPGRPAPPNGVRVAARRGVDLAAHRSKLVALSPSAAADLVVVMEPGQRRALQTLFGGDGRDVLVLSDLDPELVTTRTIPDPVDQPEAAFEASYARIDRCLDALVAAVLHRGDSR
jgi:low molecular weight protein-tyrosine phosphatase